MDPEVLFNDLKPNRLFKQVLLPYNLSSAGSMLRFCRQNVGAFGIP